MDTNLLTETRRVEPVETGQWKIKLAAELQMDGEAGWEGIFEKVRELKSSERLFISTFEELKKTMRGLSGNARSANDLVSGVMEFIQSRCKK